MGLDFVEVASAQKCPNTYLAFRSRLCNLVFVPLLATEKTRWVAFGALAICCWPLDDFFGALADTFGALAISCWPLTVASILVADRNHAVYDP